MKQLILIFSLIFVLNYSNAQTLSGKIIDSITQVNLELANITFVKTNYTVFSDLEGNFKIKIDDYRDSLRISSIGYKSRTICISDFNNKNNLLFYLTPKTEELEVVIIKNKKINYGRNIYLKSEREKNQYFGFQFGTENCKFIKNLSKKRGIITALIFDLKKIKSHAVQCWKCDVNYISTFNIKFYKYDIVNNRPGIEIYNKNIIIKPENRTYKLQIDVEPLKILFPLDGICIGVEIINTDYKNPKSTFALIAPLIKFAEIKTDSHSTSWIRYRNESWEFKPLITRDKKKKTIINNEMVMDVIFKPEL